MSEGFRSPELGANHVTLAYDGQPVVTGVSLDVPVGLITAIIGPNACGKTTLLRALARLLAPKTGQVVLDGKDIHRLPTREVAKRLGLLPQTVLAPFGITVSDLVARGRFPHQQLLRQWSAEDEEAVKAAMSLMRLTDLKERQVDELSGGQRQRVWLAMVLAQNTPLLLLDEPTTYLDIAHQIDVLDLCKQLNQEEGRTLVMVLHDLNQAARYADQIVVMKAGKVVADGEPSDVLTPELLADVFALEARVVKDPVWGTPMVVPVKSLKR